MPSLRKFYRQIVTIEVLSEESTPFDDLDDLQYAIHKGPCSGKVNFGGWEEVDGPTMAKLLEDQNSEPEFFSLTPDGEDAEE